MNMVTMDLIGPIGGRDSGFVEHPKPLHILVITDPFSHMLWLEPITGKSAEEVYSKFVTGFLLEEGAPQFILTDRGREFDNVLLRELMRLLKVRLYLTPSYHPRRTQNATLPDVLVGSYFRALSGQENIAAPRTNESEPLSPVLRGLAAIDLPLIWASLTSRNMARVPTAYHGQVGISSI